MNPKVQEALGKFVSSFPTFSSSVAPAGGAGLGGGVRACGGGGVSPEAGIHVSTMVRPRLHSHTMIMITLITFKRKF